MGFERATLTDKIQLGHLGFETAAQTQLGFDLFQDIVLYHRISFDLKIIVLDLLHFWIRGLGDGR